MEAEEGLYERYLDLCLSGEMRVPEIFLAEHPEADEGVREQIKELYKTLIGSDEEIPPFERLGEFRLLHRLEGGLDGVYLAEQEPSGRIVALKTAKPEDGARFDREAEAVAALQHKNIAGVVGRGRDQGVRYVAMEMVPGEMLSEILANVALGRRTLTADQIVRWLAQVARALDHAHAAGVVHGDVEPANIRIVEKDRALLLAFSIAEPFAGQPTYAAPEQITGGKIDGRTDVYGLGVTLYQCLTGIVPFASDTAEGVYGQTLHDAPVPPRRLRRAVSRDIETVTLKAMEKRPSARYATAGALADDLDAILEYRPIKARPPGRPTRFFRWAQQKLRG